MSKTEQGLVEYATAQLGKRELWRDVVGYEGLYQVSNFGRVKSLNYHRSGEERVIVQRQDRYGYKAVNLSKDGVARQINVHRLVATAFIDNPDYLPQVNHKDEDKTNNAVDNLEWCTGKYNMNYGTHNKRCADGISKPIIQIDLSTGEVTLWKSATQAAAVLGKDRRGICRMCHTEKEHGGYAWKFANGGITDENGIRVS